MPLSLRWHLLGLVLAALVPVLLFSGAMMIQFGKQQRAALEQQIQDVAAIIADDIDTELQQSIAALEVLAVSNALASEDLKTFYLLAQRVLKRQGWANIVLAGPNAEHLVNLRAKFGAPLSPLNRPEVFLETARIRRPYVSNVVPGLLAGRFLTVVGVPVFRDEQVKYVLVAAVAAPTWQNFLKSRLATSMQAALVDRDLAIVSRTLGGESFVGTKPVQHFVDLVSRQPEQGTLRGPSLEGVDSYAAYKRAPFSRWTVAVFMPVAAIEAPVRASLRELASGFLLLLGLGLALAWFFAKRIGTAIAQLTASVRSVGDGGAPLPVKGRIAEVHEAGVALENAAALLAERLAREQAARAALEAADRAKDQFLVALSHELRNPLAPISAALYLLDQDGAASEAARRASTVIGRQVQHLTRLVDDLLDVTRIASGKVELRREPVSLNETLRRAAEDHAQLAAKAGIELALSVPQEDVRANGDPTRLAQMIGNLLHNAMRFTQAGGRITLSLARRGAAAEIRVRDTGAGIEPALLERLFEPFVQGPQGAARTTGGLGLGLALVRALAELHGGTVRGFSAGPGKGTEFVVTLPVL